MISSKLGVLNVFSTYNMFNVQCVYPGGNPIGLGRSLEEEIATHASILA